MSESRKRLVPLLLMLAPLWAGSGLAAASSETAHAVDPALTAPIRQTLDALMRVPGGTPAMAAVIVQGDAGWIDVRGRVRAYRDGLADADTRFYIASQTKSFIGLLAAVLDARGEFPLSRTLAEVWPDLRLPPPAPGRRMRESPRRTCVPGGKACPVVSAGRSPRSTKSSVPICGVVAAPVFRPA